MEDLTMKIKKVFIPILLCALFMTSCSMPDEEGAVSSNPQSDTSSVLSLPDPMPEESTPIASEVPFCLLYTSQMQLNTQ